MKKISRTLLTASLISLAMTGCHRSDRGNVLTNPPPAEINLISVSFAQTAASISEGQQLCEMIQRDDTSNLLTEASVGLSATNGTAQAGHDFNVPTTQVVIPAGQASHQFCIPTFWDTSSVQDKTFVLKLTNPQGFTLLGSKTQMAVTIINLNIVPGSTPTPIPLPTVPPSAQ